MAEIYDFVCVCVVIIVCCLQQNETRRHRSKFPALGNACLVCVCVYMTEMYTYLSRIVHIYLQCIHVSIYTYVCTYSDT